MSVTQISIAMATYNGRHFLLKQLESVAAQTRLPHELVVSDDCSGDDTISILEDFASMVPFPVKILKNRARLGSTGNFERAIRLCSGAQIALCDQDDVWREDKLEQLAAVFQGRPQLGMVFSNAERVDADLQSLPMDLWQSLQLPEDLPAIMRSGNGAPLILLRPTVTGATMAFDASLRTLLLPMPTDNPNWIHDRWMATLITLTRQVEALPDHLILYRQHRAQQIGARAHPKRTLLQRLTDDNCNEIAIHLHAFEHLRARLLEQPNLSCDGVHLLDQGISHFRARLRLRATARLNRLPIVAHEIAAGRYRRFSTGLASAMKDIL